MRNYIELFGCIIRIHTTTGGTLDEFLGPYATFEEWDQQALPQIQAIANSFSTASFELRYFPNNAAGGTPRFYVKLNKANLLFALQFGQAALNSGIITQTSPRASWSHGH